jgi:soluble lytic murein transglycosylase-like protein
VATFARFSKAVIGQESGGRYGVQNMQGSGASGIGQIMPDTAKALSQRLGLPYRLDLLRGTSREAQAYQNALTQEALREAWNYGKGDPRRAATYYFAGPDQSKWGPKTKQYGEDILRRMGSR